MSFLPKAGDIFSGCEILGRCGKGSFGVTFLAKNPLGEKIIIKIVSSVNRSERELEGLRNYMTVAGKHPNLLQIFHIGEIDDGFFYTMEAADDCSEDPNEYHPATLGNLMRNGKKFSPGEAIAVTSSLLGGVQVMHQANLVHRDIKPDNIIFVNGQPKLSDPGLVVSLGQSASFAGTVGFLPPEAMLEEMPPSQSFDLYALGKVFYCMLTGLHPKKYPELPLNMPFEVCRQLYGVLHRVCNQNPEKRFKSAGDFLSALPSELRKPSWAERQWARYRVWKSKHYILHNITLIILLLILGVIVAGSIYSLCNKQLQPDPVNTLQSAVSAQQNAAGRLLHFHTARGDLLELQLKLYAEDVFLKYRELHDSIQQAFQQNDYQLADKQACVLNSILSSTAEKLLPQLPENEVDFLQGMTSSGKLHSFLSTPLAEFLPLAVKNSSQQKLKLFDSNLYAHWLGPRCGKEWNNMQDFEIPMTFIPAGAVKMQHNNKLIELPYFFWMGKYEITGESYAHYLSFSPRRNPRTNTPVERVAWNDILFYCYSLTETLRSADKLPPGYIVRPPTEAEWEYAANNAWLGKDDLPFSQRARYHKNSDRHSWAGGSLEPNKLGICDIYGNVSELVQPIEQPKQHNSIIIRGGSYLHTEKNCLARHEYLKFQTIPYNVGFRVVIAPGTMDYFDKEFFCTGSTQTRTNDMIYELIGTNWGVFTWQLAHDLCNFLGGSLAELQNEQHLATLQAALPLFPKWLTVIGGHKVNDQWQWYRSQRSIDFGTWSKQLNNTGQYLMIDNKKFFKAGDNTKAPIMLCQWTADEYAQRLKKLAAPGKTPLEVMRFSWQDRYFMLIAMPLQWSAAQRICEIMNGRLAVLDNTELMQYVINKLQPYAANRILLGAYAKRDKYFWSNGKLLEGKLDSELIMTIPTRNLNFVVLKNGKLYDSQFSDMLLCEWDAKTASSFWR